MKINFEPLERNGGVVFENKVVGGSVPTRIHSGGGKGHPGAGRYRRAGGLPDGGLQIHAWWMASTTTSTSSALAFEIAAKACFRDGMKKAAPIILEPIMDVEVTTPQDHVGDVVGDLNRRRGMIQNQESSGRRSSCGRMFP